MIKAIAGSLSLLYVHQFSHSIQMENIGRFLDSCYDYGLEKNDVFQTVDLYDNTNIPQVGLYECHFAHHISKTILGICHDTRAKFFIMI